MVNLWIITGGTKEMAKEDTFLAQMAGMNPAPKRMKAGSPPACAVDAMPAPNNRAAKAKAAPRMIMTRLSIKRTPPNTATVCSRFRA